MLEIALSILANALVASVIAFVLAPGRLRAGLGSWPIADGVRSLLAGLTAGAALLVVGALVLGGTPLSRQGVVGGAWCFLACAVGALASAAAGAIARSNAADAESVAPLVASRSATGAMLVAQLAVALSLTVLIALASFGAGVVRDPESAARTVPIVAAAFCVGASLGAATLSSRRLAAWIAEAALETAAGVVIATAAWQANAGFFRRGPVVATALGFIMLPLVMRPLFALATAAGSLLMKVGDDESLEDAQARGAHVAAALVVLVLAGTTFGALGATWLSFFFCGAAGVLAVLAVAFAEARRPGAPAGSAVLLAACGAAALTSEAVAERSGVLHAAPLGLMLCAAGAQGAALFARTVGVAPNDSPAAPPLSSAAAAARALGALATGAAVIDAISAAACTKWSDAVRAPTVDGSALLVHCEAARAGLGALDLGRPVVVASGLVGVGLCAFGSIGNARAVARLSAVVAFVCVVGRAFDASAVCLATCALAATLASAAAPAQTKRDVALYVAGLALALAPITT